MATALKASQLSPEVDSVKYTIERVFFSKKAVSSASLAMD